MNDRADAGPNRPDLVRRAAGGDRQAWDDLFAAVSADLRACIEAKIGPRLRGKLEVDDVLQETCLLAYRSRGRFEWRGRASFIAWLGTLASFVIRETARRERRDLEPLDAEPAVESAPPSRGLRRSERFDRLLRAYDRLSADHRRVLRLVRLEGLTVAQAAKRMGRSESSVRHLVLRALQSLREQFGAPTASCGLPPDRLVPPGESVQSKETGDGE